MKKWFLLVAIGLLVGCMDKEDQTATEQTPTSDVEQTAGENIEEPTTSESTAQLSAEQLALSAIEKLTNTAALKFTVTEMTQHHPELDLSERMTELTYDPMEEFIHKKYEDNYFAGKYESYQSVTQGIYLKNELGSNEWQLEAAGLSLDYNLQQYMSELLTSVVSGADTMEASEAQGETVIFASMPEGDFTRVEEAYYQFSDTLNNIAATEEVLQNVESVEERYEYNFTNVSIELFLNTEGEIVRYKVTFNFNEEEQNFKILEQIFYDIDPEVDYVYPPEIMS